MKTTDEINLEQLQKDFRLIEQRLQEQELVPTPSKGTSVLWFRGGEATEENAYAAIVTRREDAGILSLTVFPPDGAPFSKNGTYWNRHPTLENAEPHDERRRRNGTWDYPADRTQIRKDHYTLHREKLERQRQQIAQQIADVKAKLARVRSALQTATAPEEAPAQ